MQTIELFESTVLRDPLLPTTIAFSLHKRTQSVLEACASNLDGLIATQANPFVYAIHRAFTDHLPLVLSPDDLWLCISQAFGLHVNLHAEALRDRLVSHRGQLTIEVRRDEFVMGSADNDWPGVFEEFSQELQRHLGDVANLIVADFSTTTIVERGVSQIVLMSAMQPYFHYDFTTLCGIPSITLLGMPDDWRAIRRRAEAFAQYDLESWISALRPILDQFVAASTGDVDRDFWQSVYKLGGGSGGPYVSGWINTLFPYIKRYSEESGKDAGELKVNEFAYRWEGTSSDDEKLPTSSQFPWGLSRAPFVWHYYLTDFPMEFVGGFVGVSQNPETMAVRPAIGWAVRKTADASFAVASSRN
jgi:Domain of unknown function (DUF4419)